MGPRSIFLTLALFLLILPLRTYAESSSANYILWANAVAGGGGRTTSTSFTDYGSAADASAALPENSTNFHAVTGFEALYEEPRITMSVSPNVVTLSPNPMTTAAVSTGSTTVSVATNADFGYSLKVYVASVFQNQSGNTIPGVSDGSVTAGAGEQGIAVSGTDAAFADDRSIGSGILIASRNIWTGGVNTTVTYKVGISTTTAAGTYSGTGTFIATGHY